MNELVRRFWSQSGVHGSHWKDVEVGIQVKRGRFSPSVPSVSMTSIRGGDDGGNARDYVRTLSKWLGAGRKDPDCLHPYGCDEPESREVRTTGRLKDTPFQQHDEWISQEKEDWRACRESLRRSCCSLTWQASSPNTTTVSLAPNPFPPDSLLILS